MRYIALAFMLLAAGNIRSEDKKEPAKIVFTTDQVGVIQSVSHQTEDLDKEIELAQTKKALLQSQSNVWFVGICMAAGGEECTMNRDSKDPKEWYFIITKEIGSAKKEMDKKGKK